MNYFSLLKILVLTIGGFWLGFSGFRFYEAQQVIQPYKFDHSAHRIMKCELCHSGAIDGIRATLPSYQICKKCHASSPLTDDKNIKSWKEAEEINQFQWRKFTSVPDHVFFSHRQHTKSGKIECKKCHGDISNLTEPPPLALIRIDMDICIECHLSLEQTDDCAHCHK